MKTAHTVQFKQQPLEAITGEAQRTTRTHTLQLLDGFMTLPYGARGEATAQVVRRFGTNGHDALEQLRYQAEATGKIDTIALYKTAAAFEKKEHGPAATTYLTTGGAKEMAARPTGWIDVLAQDPTLAGEHDETQLRRYAMRVVADVQAAAPEKLAAGIIGLRDYDGGDARAIEGAIAYAIRAEPLLQGLALAAIEGYADIGQDRRAQAAIRGVLEFGRGLDEAGYKTVVDEIRFIAPDLLTDTLTVLHYEG